MLINLPKETQLLLCCALLEIDEETARKVKDLLVMPLDWSKVLEMAQRHGISEILYHNLKRVDGIGKIPQVYLQELQAYYFRTAAYNLQIREAAKEVLKALESQGIEVIVLKGLALSETAYKNIAIRPMSDVDLLVHREDIGPVNKAFFELGYIYSLGSKLAGEDILETAEIFKRLSFEIGFQRKGVGLAFDVHWNLTSPGDYFRVDLGGIWTNAVPGNIGGVKVLLLSPTDQLIYLCINAARNLYSPLTCLCDIAALIKLFSEQIDWNYITKDAPKWLAKNPTYYALFLTKHLLAASVPEAVLKEISPKGLTKLVFNLGERDILYRKDGSTERTILPIVRLFLRDRFQEKEAFLLNCLFPGFIKRYFTRENKPIWSTNSFKFKLFIKGLIALLRFSWRAIISNY